MTKSSIEQVTENLRRRSMASRRAYLNNLQKTKGDNPPKRRLSCGNLAHGYAACNASDKQSIRLMQSANLGIVNAYNDMLSAHQPLGAYPDLIKQFANEFGSTAQVAGGVPAMCDGVTQGQPGMELSLFSRDVIAMATAVSLSHNIFDGVLCLGVCDKIVPGLLIGALQFGHLPCGFIAAGPMPSGITNKEKAAVRQRYAENKASRDELLAAESASYHSPGTCTFYGTANTNQLLLEAMGVQLPGASFINPEHPLRPLLIKETVKKVIAATDNNTTPRPLSELITEASVINAVILLLASGGSTNHTLHLVAIARACGIQLEWRDLADIAKNVPLLMHVYPNGDADVNDFQRAGGTAFLFRDLRNAGLLNEDVYTLMGAGLDAYEYPPGIDDSQQLQWGDKITTSSAETVLRSASNPFDHESGLRILNGNLGESVIKVSALKPEQHKVRAPCVVFHQQSQLKEAFQKGELDRDVIAVVRFQGPKANGMPELHQLTPYLGVLQDRGYKVALVTDGRMSGASGKVPAAIHLTPEALDCGPIAKLRTGDMIELDADNSSLNVEIDAAEWNQREASTEHEMDNTLGRQLFSNLRRQIGKASNGASVFDFCNPTTDE
jgi:phosphogluconate dehydratase